MKKLFDFSCINISIGYYDYHTPNEYVILEDVENGIKIGREMIASLGYEKYKKRYVPVMWSGGGNKPGVWTRMEGGAL